jgi:hypothetical protein
MITPDDIRKKAMARYIPFLRNLAEGIPFSKLVITGDKSYSRSSWIDFQSEIQAIISQSKEKKKYGYTLEFQQVKTKYLGLQDLPKLISFDSQSDFLLFLGKEQEVENFEKDVSLVTTAFPELAGWINRNPGKIIGYHGKWDSILKICQYFRQNPRPGLYIRELPVPVHTKFVEQHQAILRELLDTIITDYINPGENQFERRFNLKYREPQIRFKILDKSISLQFFSGIDDLAIPLSSFEALNLPLKKVLVVENKTNLFTTLTLPFMQDTMAVFGEGNAVLNLGHTPWLSEMEILYWGDIDVHGFEILSRLRAFFPHTRSVLMDKATFDRFFEHDSGAVSGNPSHLNLSYDERNLYDLLKANNWRLEQEKIPQCYVIDFFQNTGI